MEVLVRGHNCLRHSRVSIQHYKRATGAEQRRVAEKGRAWDRPTEIQEQEFERAREIQQSLLPKNIPQLRGFEVAGAWQPARSVSGDYYDVLKLGDHGLEFALRMWWEKVYRPRC